MSASNAMDLGATRTPPTRRYPLQALRRLPPHANQVMAMINRFCT